MKILKNRLIVGVISIVAAIAIGFLAVPLLMSITNQKIEIIVASQAIPKGSKITEDMLRTFEMFSSDIPAGADLKYSDVVGKYALIDIQESDVIFTGKFDAEFPFDDQVLYQIPVGKYAVAVTVPHLAESVAGKIRSSDIVTVLVSIEGSNVTGEVNNAQTFLELMYMQVLTVTTAEGSDVVREPDLLAEKKSSNLPSVVTLLCNLEQARMLAGFEAYDRIHLALTARGDSELAEEYQYVQEELFIRREEAARRAEEARLSEEVMLVE